MLSKTFEFLRIADVQPTDEKVRKRTQSATDLLTQIESEESPDVLLALLQGVVAGFDKPPFTQDSPVIALVIKAVKDQDAAFPNDLKENATELRAVAAIAIGELLIASIQDGGDDDANLVALAIRSALSLRPQSSDKHIRWALNELLLAGDQLLNTVALHRRRRNNAALQDATKMKETTPASATDLWTVVVPKLKAALQEAANRAAIDREELETLWWLFTGYSEVTQKPLLELSPSAAAFCSGIELARRALLPPPVNAPAMVKRATETGRKAATLAEIPLQESVKEWSDEMIKALAPTDGSSDDTILGHPALLPIAWACKGFREHGGAPKLGKEFPGATGIPLDRPHSPAEWGAQVFRESVLLRILTEEEN
jgi:hypothetical protein